MVRSLVAAVACALLALPGAAGAAGIVVDGRTAARPKSTVESAADRPLVPRRDDARPLARPASRPGTPRPAAAPRAPESPAAARAAARALGFNADSIVVEKAAHRLTLFLGGTVARVYSVALGQSPSGAKVQAGDNRTPEGLYFIDARNPFSRFHLGLRVSYPNADDRARARELGVPTGGDIMIHGLPNGQGQVGAAHAAYDWTNGCVAVTDDEIEEIWSAVPVGTPIRILP
jgi:lipoprotein-anchoring transpeptidase ErfK/SrfK